MTAMAVGIGLSAIGGILGYGAAKDQEKALKRSAHMTFQGRLKDTNQARKDFAARRIRDQRAVRASTEAGAAAAGAMPGNLSALRVVANERAIGAGELSRTARRDRFVIGRMLENAEIERMNTLSQASAAGSQATASLINAGVNIASFAMPRG